MKIRVLGTSGSEVPGRNLPAFLIDDTMLMDAGTIGLLLNSKEQMRIKHILITHAHLDHVKGIPFLLDNMSIANSGHSITLLSGREVLLDIRKNLLNDKIWPDFTKIPDSKNPSLRFKAIQPSRPITINGYKIYCEKMDHAVPAYGYIIEQMDKKALAYTGDTGPSTFFWQKVSDRRIDCLIVDVSFPNRMNEIAEKSGHLTPALLKKEVSKMVHVPARIYATHIKPQYAKEISREIQALGIKNIKILKDNQIITL